MVRPNQLFLGSAFSGSALFTSPSHHHSPLEQFAGLILVAHTFLLILGLGLLIGGRIAGSTAIALLAVIGVPGS